MMRHCQFPQVHPGGTLTLGWRSPSSISCPFVNSLSNNFGTGFDMEKTIDVGWETASSDCSFLFVAKDNL